MLKLRPAAKAVVDEGFVVRDLSHWIVRDFVTDSDTGCEAGIDVPNDDDR
jgi:hypothetical protein